MNNDFQSSSRSGYRAKRKKTNLILNSLIIVIVVLIIFVAFSIFSSGNDNASSKKDAQNTAVKSASNKKENNNAAQASSDESSGTTDNSAGTTDSSSTTDQQNGDSSTGNTDESQTAATDDGSSANVGQSTENPDWKPVGTTQSGTHTVVYDTSSQDWKEMLNAISYATGLDQGNMIVWHLGRDKSAENASVGTVSSKDKQQKYKVYIQWVEGQGWKPTKVEQLTDLQNGN
jgi:cytoskeletal protein RodZ